MMVAAADWPLWFAFMEHVPPNFTLEFTDEQIQRLDIAFALVGRARGATSVEEFLEMIFWEIADDELLGAS